MQKPTKIVSLEGIIQSIEPEEILKANKNNGFSITRQEPCDLIKYNFTIESNAPFGGVECEKKYIYHKGKLKICNFIKYGFSKISEPNKIYNEIFKYNGSPDDISFDKTKLCLKYIWHGQNGVILYNHYSKGIISVTFKLYN